MCFTVSLDLKQHKMGKGNPVLIFLVKVRKIFQKIIFKDVKLEASFASELFKKWLAVFQLFTIHKIGISS